MKKHFLFTFVLALIILMVSSCAKNNNVESGESSLTSSKTDTGESSIELSGDDSFEESSPELSGDDSSEDESNIELEYIPWEDYSDENPVSGVDEAYVLIKQPYTELGDPYNPQYNYYVKTNGNIITIYITDEVEIKGKFVGIVGDNGNLKEYLHYNIHRDKNTNKVKMYVSSKTEYNQNGIRLKSTGFNSNGDITSITEYKYDEQGKLKEEKNTSGDKISLITYTYDNSGNLIEHKKTVNGEVQVQNSWVYNDKGILTEYYWSNGRQKNVYDENGNVISYIRIDENGIEIPENKLEYDESGRLIKVIVYNEDGSEYVSSIYSYDSNGNLISKMFYDVNGNLDESNEYEYDNRGNKIKEIYKVYENNNIYTSIMEWIYDENNYLTEYIFNQGVERVVYSYDEYGNKTSESHYNRNGSIDYTYQYTWEKVCYPEGFYQFLNDFFPEQTVVKVN